MGKPLAIDSSDRISLVEAKANSVLVIDPSRDLKSLDRALDFLNQQGLGREKILLVNGSDNPGLIDRLNSKLKVSGLKVFILGLKAQNDNEDYPIGLEFKESLEQLFQEESKPIFEDKAILIKGFNGSELERILTVLEEKSHNAVMEIDLGKMIYNLNYYRDKLKKETKAMVMVKAFSYGSGNIEIAKHLEHHKVDYLGVAYADEGAVLRKQGIKIPILVLNTDPSSFQTILDYNLEQEIYSFHVLEEYLEFIKKHNRVEVPGIHLQIETGMNRLGFDLKQLPQLVEIINSEPLLKVLGVSSHLASADSNSDEEFTNMQIEKFKEAKNFIASKIGDEFLSHILNTSGISNYPDAQFDMVRLGIGLYGITSEKKDKENLLPISSLKARISQIKKVDMGESIGYSRSYIAEKQMSIAIVNIGYADGIKRELSNGIGSVFFKGKSLKIVGKVCMDMCMVDVTGIEIRIHDEVEIYGANKSLYSLANEMNTIPYEVLTSISQRVKRTYLL